MREGPEGRKPRQWKFFWWKKPRGRRLLQEMRSEVEIKLKSLILAQIERWRHA